MFSIDLGTSRRAAVPVAPLSNDNRIRTDQKERKKNKKELVVHTST
jgi:hypothetical protein